MKGRHSATLKVKGLLDKWRGDGLYFHSVLLYFLCILVHSIGTDHRKKKSLDRKYVLLRQAGVKQKRCKVSVVEKNISFSLFQRHLVDYYVDPLLKVIY